MFTTGKDYPAKVVGANVTTTKSGSPQIHLEFHVSDEQGNVKPMGWYGGLSSEKAVAFTIKNLLTVGYTGDGANLAALSPADFQPTAGLTVSMEDHEGNMRIQWINSPLTAKATSKPFAGQLPNLAAVMQKARQELGVKKPVSLNDF